MKERVTGISIFKELFKDPLGASGFFLLICFFLVSLLGIFLTAGKDPILDPKQVRLHEKLRPPLSRASPDALEDSPLFGIYLLGTDDLGRDVFARMLQGAYVSMSVGFVSVGLAVVIGIILGGISGYFGERSIGWVTLLSMSLCGAGAYFLKESHILIGLSILLLGIMGFLLKPRLLPIDRGLFSIDTFIMRLVDIMLCFPSFFLILTVVALLPPSIYNIMVVIGLTSWMGTARFVRAEFLALREQEFVKAAKVLGLSHFRIIFFHMLPNAMGPVLVSATLGVASAILVEAGLSFLGLGVPPPHATWGNILSDGKNYLFDAPWLTFVPGTAILVVVLSFNLFGESLREIINPRLKA